MKLLQVVAFLLSLFALLFCCLVACAGGEEFLAIANSNVVSFAVKTTSGAAYTGTGTVACQLVALSGANLGLAYNSISGTWGTTTSNTSSLALTTTGLGGDASNGIFAGVLTASATAWTVAPGTQLRATLVSSDSTVATVLQSYRVGIPFAGDYSGDGIADLVSVVKDQAQAVKFVVDGIPQNPLLTTDSRLSSLGGSISVIVPPYGPVASSGQIIDKTFRIRQHSAWKSPSGGAIAIPIIDSAGHGVDLTGKTLALRAYAPAAPGTAVFTLTASSGLTVSGSTISISADSATTQTARTLRWIIWNTTDTVPIGGGTLVIEPEIAPP